MSIISDAAFVATYVQWVQHRSFCYAEPSDKDRFHLESKRLLRILAKQLGLNAGYYELRSNKGGVAVSGEIILHSSSLYVLIHGAWSYRGIQIMFRRCSGRNDMAGKVNHYAPIHALLDMKTLVRRMDAVAGRLIVSAYLISEETL